MKKSLIISLLLTLIIGANAQDSLTLAQFRYDFMNIKMEENRIELYDAPMWEPAYILAGTFAANQIIVSTNPNPNPLLTGSIFIVGGAWSLHVFLKKSRKSKQNNNESKSYSKRSSKINVGF